MQAYLYMQINLKKITHFDKDKVRAYLQETGAELQVREGPVDQAYINFLFQTQNILPIWQHLQRLLASEPAIRDAALVCCTGKHGWDDYLLLHGATEGETLDVLDG